MARRYETPQIPFEAPDSPEGMLRTVVSILGEEATSTKAAGTKAAFEKAVATKSPAVLYRCLVETYGEAAADALIDLCNGEPLEVEPEEHLFASAFRGAQI